jgi:hypothetical protein
MVTPENRKAMKAEEDLLVKRIFLLVSKFRYLKEIV